MSQMVLPFCFANVDAITHVSKQKCYPRVLGVTEPGARRLMALT